jgi:hypothetical protein
MKQIILQVPEEFSEAALSRSVEATTGAITVDMANGIRVSGLPNAPHGPEAKPSTSQAQDQPVNKDDEDEENEEGEEGEIAQKKPAGRAAPKAVAMKKQPPQKIKDE